MPTLLHIDSSPAGEGSISRHLTAEFVRNWKRANPSGRVIVRDLTATPIPPLSAAVIGAYHTPLDKLTPAQSSLVALSDQLIGELEAADEYVIGVPMHNFGIPAVLKLWVDQIVRANKTFSYGTGTPVGLLRGKKGTVIIAAGGSYEAGSPLASYDFVEPYLRALFGFLGVTDLTFLSAGGAAALQTGKTDRAAFLRPHVDAIRSKFA